VRPTSDGVYAYFALACAWTWALAVPAALAWTRHEAPPAYAVACAGLSAFGPTIAAWLVAARRGELRDVFGRWRASPTWIGVALVTPLAIHLVAVALTRGIGDGPVEWFHPPRTSEDVGALFVFPLGEEFGWRGFAHARMVRRRGPVVGPLIVGFFWGLWHLMYAITPAAAGFDFVELGMTMLELPLYALVIAWIFEHAGRSMAVAIAFHAGAHLDHIERAPRADLTLHAVHLAVVAVAAAMAVRSLRRRAA
jgi:membrane protease YdiL (CAAX protease family)